MKLKSLVIIYSLLFCLLPVQAQQITSATFESEKLTKLLENSFEDFLKFNPVTATAIGDHRYDDQFPNSISEEYRAKVAVVDSLAQASLNGREDGTARAGC